MSSIEKFIQARDFLITHRKDYETAYKGFRCLKLDLFNWALDYFDVYARDNHHPALWVVNESGDEVKMSFAEMSQRSNQAGNFLRSLGIRRGDPMLVMLPNVVPIWEITLAAMKLGAVVSPATTMLTPDDLRERIDRGNIRHVITDMSGLEKLSGINGLVSRVLIGGAASGWTSYADSDTASTSFTPDGPTHADDPLFLYFTSGTTAKPKMVMHTHQTYPVGHLSTMYWIGVQEGDIHFNISSPGWAKHAWSNFFAPWNAGACVFVYNYESFNAKKVLQAIVKYEVTTLCAPPTVWRNFLLEDLKAYPVKLREAISAGEPLNPEVIEQVRTAWNITIRDGYGQTETTAQIGNSPGQKVKLGSMGRPLPGYQVVLLDFDGHEGSDGEISLSLKPRPTGLMAEYANDPKLTAAALGGGFYRTSDTASRDEDGYYWYIGRTDDVFKSSDYRISPFELESVLIEHEAVTEAAVVPGLDPLRLNVPKAYVVLKPGIEPSRETALSILQFTRKKLSPYKRIRRIEFFDLPKTISGKIRRVQLRGIEIERHKSDTRGEHEFWEKDFPELR